MESSAILHKIPTLTHQHGPLSKMRSMRFWNTKIWNTENMPIFFRQIRLLMQKILRLKTGAYTKIPCADMGWGPPAEKWL